jgi:hypothetical protein
MGMPRGALVACIAALCLTGLTACAGRTGPSPEQSCAPGLVVSDVVYRPVEAQTSTLEEGAPVPDARYLRCGDGDGRSGGGPVDAWRAAGMSDSYVVTLSECARLAGTPGAADCDPTASRYLLWKAELR